MSLPVLDSPETLFLREMRRGLREIGKPRERNAYTFRGAAKKVLESVYDEVLLVGPADTGKTLACCALLDKLAWKYPRAQLAMVRKRRTDMDASCLKTFSLRILQAGDGVEAFGGSKPQWFDYPNGSRIWVAGMDKESKVLSAEFDGVYVNQVEELSLPEWETLGTRASGRAGAIPYGIIFGDCNPAHPSHWIQSRAKANLVVLLESYHQDNPELFSADGGITVEGKQRLARLEKLTGARKLRLLRGIWAAPEGAIYDVFDDTKHKVAAFDPPRLWPRMVGIDPLGAYTAAVFLAWDADAGVLNVYDEYYQPFGETTVGHVSKILQRVSRRHETIFAWVGGGPSERQARTDWREAGIPLLTPPVADVWSGIDKVYNLLKDFKLVVHDNCSQLLCEIGDYQRILKDGQPTDNIMNKETYHLLDALRYIVVWLTTPGETSHVVYAPISIGDDY